MRGWIKDQLGIDMTADHISTAKGTILRQARRTGKRTRKQEPASPTGEATPPAAPAPAAAGGKGPGISLENILYVKDLVGRLGAGPASALVDAFAR
jgi:hypothetical protein